MPPVPPEAIADIRARLDALAVALAEVDLSDPTDTLARLNTAREQLDGAITEAMAAAALAGASLRSIAGAVGLTENSAPPRLAASRLLGGYADETGRVRAGAISRARYDRESAVAEPPAGPLRWTFRKPS